MQFTRYPPRRNPLVYWQNTFKGTPGSVLPEYAGILQSESETRFRAAFAQSDRVLEAKGLLPFRISVIIPDTDEPTKRASELGRASKSLVATQGVGGKRADRDGFPPGDDGRITPYTPFNFFHRLEHGIGEDVLRTAVDPRKGKFFSGNVGELNFVPTNVFRLYNSCKYRARNIINSIDDPTAREHVRRIIYNTGFDTKAARMHTFTDPDEAAADVFAKYVTSTKPVRDGHSDRPFGEFNRDVWDRLNKKKGQENKTQEVVEAAHFFGACAEIRAAQMAATLGMFIEGYYAGRAPPEVNIKMSEMTMTDIGEGEGTEYELADAAGDYEAFTAALFLLDRTLRGPTPRPGLFLSMS